MAIKVKVMERPIEEVSYVRATVKGLALTFKHLVDPHKVTVQYPDQRWDISPRWRGTHRMLTTEDGKAKCVACGLCPTVCPANCIKLVPGEDEQGNRYPLVFEIDEFRKYCLINGLDDIGLTLRHADAIRAFEDKRKTEQPWLFA